MWLDGIKFIINKKGKYYVSPSDVRDMKHDNSDTPFTEFQNKISSSNYQVKELLTGWLKVTASK